MSNMAMTDPEIVELFAKIHQQECENVALEQMLYELQVGWRKMINALLGS